MSDVNLATMCYASTATERCSAIEIGLIVEAAKKNNIRANITGVLFFGNNYFLQILEGPRNNLNILYNKIIRDERHTNMQVLELREIGSRYFHEWSMKFVDSPAVATKICKESGFKEFNPYLLDGRTLSALALAFCNHHESSEPTSLKTERTAELHKKSNFDILKLFGRHT